MAIAKVINTEAGQFIIVPNSCTLDCSEVVMVPRDESYLITPKNVALKHFNESIGSFDDSYFEAMDELEREREVERQALREYYKTQEKKNST